jgi:hypothetical protein
MGDTTSRLRLRLRDAAQRHAALVDKLLAERGPLLRGAFRIGGTRCGKAGCKCNEGELHTTALLLVSVDGVRRNFYIRGPERAETQRKADRYQHVRRLRAELAKLQPEVLAIADELVASICEPLPVADSDSASAKRRPARGRTKR